MIQASMILTGSHCLLREFSYNGPCMLKYDLNRDGLEDVFIGGASWPGHQYFHATEKWFICQAKEFRHLNRDKACEMQILRYSMQMLMDIRIFILPAEVIMIFQYQIPLLQDRLYLNDGKNNFIRSRRSPED